MTVARNQTATKGTHPFSCHCSRPGCEWRSAHQTEYDAVEMETSHPCPYKLVKRKYLMDVTDEHGQPYTKPTLGQSLIEKVWDALDAYLNGLMELDPSSPNRSIDGATMQATCKSLAWVIHIALPNWYPSVDDVTREAVKRREIHLGTRDFEPTPGYQYNPIPRDHPSYQKMNEESMGSPSAGQTATRTVRKRAAAQYRMKPGDEEAIKNGLAMGLDPDELAKMLQIPVDVVKKYVQ